MTGVEAAYVLLYVVNPLTILLTVMVTKGIIMSEVQSAIDAVTAQLVKAKGEILAQVAALELMVAAGATPDLTGLKAVAESLDAIVPDVPVVDVPVVDVPVVDVPVEEVPVDEAPVEPVVTDE